MSKARNLIQQIRTIQRLNREYPQAEYSYHDNHPLVTIGTMRFTGHYSPYYLRRLSFLTKIPADHIQLMFDVDFRYRKKEPLDNNDVVFEVGAYIGIQAIFMSKQAKSVVAIEAEPENYKLLVANIALNNIDNIIPIQLAAYNKKGVVLLNTKERQENSIISEVVSGNKIPVPCDTIDNIYQSLKLDKVTLVRLQINGAEGEALEGMTKVLQMNPRLSIANQYSDKE